MNDAPTAPQPSPEAPAAGQALQELKVTAHLMAFDPGVFCVFQSPGTTPPDGSGLPGVRISPPPGSPATPGVDIAGFRPDGWLGEANDALLVRVRAPTRLLVTVYQRAGDQARPPSLQVARVAEVEAAAPHAPPHAPPHAAPAPPPPTAPRPPAEPASPPDLAAHVQGRGDVPGAFGAWLGEPGSGRWIEGYAIAPPPGIAADDLEYQAVLGRGWLSPWVAAGEFCGSRGMALPILCLRVRLRGAAAEAWRLAVEASFVDGTRLGPIDTGEQAEAPSLAPLEAFLIRLTPRAEASSEEPSPLPPELPAEPPAEAVSPAPAARRRRGR